jgi:2-dehydro-3-deoxygluconokinase
VALAALGRGTGWWSILPDNRLGRRVDQELRSLRVDTSTVRWEPEGRLGTYFVELADPPRPVRVEYDRRGSSASTMTPSDVPWEVVDGAAAVVVSGITPALSPTCRETSEALADRVRGGSGLWVVDVNYRAQLWPTAEARACLDRIAAEADLVVCTSEDARDVFGLPGPAGEVAVALRDRLGARRVVVTDGERGASWVDGDGSGQVPAVQATIVDRLGAGDAFTAGVIDGVLDGDLPRGVRQGAAMGALALGISGDHLRTTRREVDALLDGARRAVDR